MPSAIITAVLEEDIILLMRKIMGSGTLSMIAQLIQQEKKMLSVKARICCFMKESNENHFGCEEK
jgi:spore maturation protein SpmB